MKILSLTDSKNPWHSYWIRVGQYLNDIQIESIASDNISSLESLRSNDVLILYRYSALWGDMENRLKNLSQNGVLIISDIDDCLWQAENWGKERLFGLTNNLKNSHIITCSTNRLKELLNIMFPSKKIILIKNSTPPEKTITDQYKGESIRIVWTGAPWTRPNDLRLLIPLTSWIRSENINIKWVHIGHVEGQLSFSKIVGIDESSVEKIPLLPYKSYLKEIKGEIGLAPLANCGFNDFKSELKLLEYSGLGIPWIASYCGPYKDLCDRWDLKGRLCKTPVDWISNLKELLNNKVRSSEGMVLKAKSHSLQGYNETLNKWKSILYR